MENVHANSGNVDLTNKEVFLSIICGDYFFYFLSANEGLSEACHRNFYKSERDTLRMIFSLSDSRESTLGIGPISYSTNTFAWPK